jgi:hypothetical protein
MYPFLLIYAWMTRRLDTTATARDRWLDVERFTVFALYPPGPGGEDRSGADNTEEPAYPSDGAQIGGILTDFFVAR